MRKVIIVFTSFVTAALITAGVVRGVNRVSNVRAQNDNSSHPKKWQALAPVDEAAEAVDENQRISRQAKNRRYNSQRSDQILDKQPADVVYGRIDESRRPSALPIGESDAVILGTIVAAQPYLAQDKKSIYTEFTVRLEEIFKSGISANVKLQNMLVVDQEGGALRMKDGRVIKYFVGGTSRLPNLNGRYVFFLSLIHNNQDLSILTGYELTNRTVISLEDGGEKSPYANWDESRFLDSLRNAVAQTALSY